jgi:hypothetical protein
MKGWRDDKRLSSIDLLVAILSREVLAHPFIPSSLHPFTLSSLHRKGRKL